MGYTCFVPECRSGYRPKKGEKPPVKKPTLFTPSLHNLKKWRLLIPRTDRVLQTTDRICEKHFEEKYIKRVSTVSLDGKVIASQVLKTPALLPDAVPTIFPGCQNHLSKKLLKHCTDPLTRKRSQAQLQESGKKRKRKETVENNNNNVSSEMLHQIEEECNREQFQTCRTDALKCTEYPNGWGVRDYWLPESHVLIFSNSAKGKGMIFTSTKQVTVFEDLKFVTAVMDRIMTGEGHVNDFQDILNVIIEFENQPICIGVPFKKEFAKTSLTNASIDKLGRWRHNLCPLTIDKINTKCKHCSHLVKELRGIKSDTIRRVF